MVVSLVQGNLSHATLANLFLYYVIILCGRHEILKVYTSCVLETAAGLVSDDDQVMPETIMQVTVFVNSRKWILHAFCNWLTY